MKLRHMLLYGAGGLAGAAVAYLRLRPAGVRRACVASIYQDGFWYAHVIWAYTPGVRPVNVIVDLRAANGAHGSLTVCAELTSGTIPLSAQFAGAYELTLTATYRASGRLRPAIWSFPGALA
ncbi:MAG: hypothetical protein ACLFVO_16365 [Chloroflexaceae bacterium]